MPDIQIHRDHQLGLAKARQVAWAGAEEAEAKFDMECVVIQGDDSDVVEYKRSGVSGRLLVAADRFELDAKLGFLLGAFSKTIQAEITQSMDTLLSQNGAVPATLQTAATSNKNDRKTAGKKGSA